MSSKSSVDRAASAARFPRDMVIGFCIVVLCAIAYWITLSIAEAPAAVAQNVQPATFPRLVISVIAILAVVLMAISFRKDSRPGKSVPAMVAMTGAMMLAFVISFEVLGFILTMVLFCFTMPVIWGERRWHAVIPFAVLFPGAIYALFALGLGVHFDAGILGF
ncbi:tripartite tricarboxylate transporter TctB family protein [Nisaea sp.]|uniref:tripartite tricarboxylate transporter TctB family protein n=1 Tax=Nisaea sp. TaxID=2024842 RepID=UPI0032EF5C74